MLRQLLVLVVLAFCFTLAVGALGILFIDTHLHIFLTWRGYCAGRPAAGKELTQDFNVLEAGLWNSISLTKGTILEFFELPMVPVIFSKSIHLTRMLQGARDGSETYNLRRS